MTKTLKKGFTLVELIVVIAIIAILASVSVVGYSAFIKNANQSKVDQELAQVENILMAEAIEGIVISKDVSEGEGTPVIETISMTLEGTTLVFKVRTGHEETDFQDLVTEAGVPANMVENLTLEQDETPEESARILYTIGDAESFIVVSIVEVPIVEP